ncbi:MAG: hypothetical protein AB7O37_12835 [Vicinamibacteria bacterium]
MPNGVGASLPRSLWAVPIVLLSAAGVLRALDEIPLLLTGGSREFVRHASLEQAEAGLRVMLLLPAFFPDDLLWPPAGIASAGRPVVVCMSFRSRADGSERMRLCQTAATRAEWPAELLPPPSRVLMQETVALPLAPETARLLTLRMGDAGVWSQLEWEHAERRLLLRFRGSRERALRLAASLRRVRS